MSSREIDPLQPRQISQQTPEAGEANNELVRSPRVVLFGSRSAGTYAAAEFIEDAIKDIPGSDVEVARYVTSIEDAFYGRFKRVEEKSLEVSKPEQKSGRLKRVTNLVLRRTVEPTAFSSIHNEFIKREDTIPQGVVIFPEMRQYDPYTNSNMTIPTPVKVIENLCRKHEVPMAFVNNEGDMGQIQQLAQGLSK